MATTAAATTTAAYVVRMTEVASGAVTYVTARGNTKARGRALQFTRHGRALVQKFADEWAATNPGFAFTVEEV